MDTLDRRVRLVHDDALMTDRTIKDRILARRNQFLALAVTGAGAVACTPSAGQEPSSSPLVVAVEPPATDADASKDAGVVEVEPEPGEPDTEPAVCLSPAEPEMRPCLSMVPPAP